MTLEDKLNTLHQYAERVRSVTLAIYNTGDHRGAAIVANCLMSIASPRIGDVLDVDNHPAVLTLMEDLRMHKGRAFNLAIDDIVDVVDTLRLVSP